VIPFLNLKLHIARPAAAYHIQQENMRESFSCVFDLGFCKDHVPRLSIGSDLQSQNGTYVNGKPITRIEITPGTRFTIGDMVLCFQKRLTSISSALSDVDSEISEEDLDSLIEISIGSPPSLPPVVTPVSVPEVLPEKPAASPLPSPTAGSDKQTPAIADTNNALQEFYKGLKGDSNKKTKSMPKPTVLASKPRAQKRFTGVIALVIVLVLGLVLVWPKFTTSEKPESPAASKTNKPDATDDIPLPTPAKLAIIGRIVAFQKREERIEYFVVAPKENPGQEVAVCLPAEFPTESTAAIVEAKAKASEVTVIGIPKILTRGRLSLSNGATTRDYILGQSLQCGDKVFKP
jgi:hypothetical protein